jgi:hypothetical protein
METQTLIKELRDIFVLKYPEHEGKIGKGSSREQIESSITKIRPIPQALIDIYSCVGGENSDLWCCFDLLIAGYNIVPLDQIDSTIDLYEELRLGEWARYFNDLSESEFNKVARWKPDMIPFLEDGCGSSVVLRTLPNDESVWKMSKYSDPKKVNTNLSRFLLITIECHRQGVYEEDEDGEEAIEIDWDLAKEIASSIDPEIQDYSHP